MRKLAKFAVNPYVVAYRQKNKLERIIVIQNITLQHTSRGVSQEWVYKNLIYPVYFISKRTYYNYLATNARRQVRGHRQLEFAF